MSVVEATRETLDAEEARMIVSDLQKRSYERMPQIEAKVNQFAAASVQVKSDVWSMRDMMQVLLHLPVDAVVEIRANTGGYVVVKVKEKEVIA
jgi:hypothetical protein